MKIENNNNVTLKHSVMENKKFETQLLEVEKVLENFAYSLTFNQEEAKDLVQETFLKALLHQENYEEDSNLKAWLLTIMRNTFINNYRRNKKIQTFVSKENTLPYLNNIACNNIYDADTPTQHSQILLFIDKLPMEQKLPFEMLNQGYKYYEIAEACHIPIGTVKSRIFLARQKLSAQLKQ